MTGDEGPSPAVLLGRGARSCEHALLGEVERLCLSSLHRGPLLPVRIVVPSRCLRQHVLARLVKGGSRLGVRVQTLRGLAAEILERAGEPLPAGTELLEVLVGRAARAHLPLQQALGSLDDGWRPLTVAVRDLLDAGFSLAHEEAVLERLAALGPAGEPVLGRVRSVVAVAAEVGEAADRLGVGGSTALWQRAAALLAGRGPDLLPSRAVLVHGFAEATGLALDLLEAIVRQCQAQVVVDEPKNPARPCERDSGYLFTRRLRERLAGSRGERVVSGCPDAPPTLRGLAAEGVEGEVRAVGAAVRALLDEGVSPEDIGVVARQVAAWEAAMAVVWQRLGIPFTVEGGKGLVGPSCRRLAAVSELLQRGAGTRLDSWLAASAATQDVDDLRLALRLAGAATVGEVAALDVAELLGGGERFGLPVRTGLDAEDDGEATRLVARRRWVSRSRLEDAVESARRVCAVLGSRRPATVARHLQSVRRLMAEVLDLQGAGREGIEAVLANLAGSLPVDLDLEWGELVLLMRRALADAGREALGGSGAGVRVLGVTQARGLTFEHLFLMGLNRDVFPRVVSEDPLLPDWVRGALLPILPDLHVKAGGHDEERYLFAHLLGAAAHVTLSWQAADDDARVVPPSPLVQRLRLARPEVVVARCDATPCAPGSGPAIGLDHAVAAGLVGDREAWEETLTLAMDEGDRGVAGRAPSLAAARHNVLEEVDPVEGWQVVSAPSPYLGLVGALGPGGETEGMLFVTTLEAMSDCPWRTFLRRFLRIEPPWDPLGELGGFAGHLVGSVVHGALAVIAGDPAGVSPRWDEAVGGTPRREVWPAPARLEALTAGVAVGVARREGGWPAGLVVALTRRALAWLQVAGRIDWSGGAPAVLGVEVPGRVVVQDSEGRPRSLQFACDRVDRAPGGEVTGTDYKTGKPISDASGMQTRRKHLHKAIRSGKALQAAAYARAAGEGGAGRYLYLGPDLADSIRDQSVENRDAVAMSGFDAAVSALLGAWDSGVFLPRLTDPAGREPGPACRLCEMREACVQYDSGLRRRLHAWVAGGGGDGVSAAAAQLWNLQARTDGEGDA